MTGREFSLWFFEKQNWRWVFFVSMMLLSVPIAIYHFATIDPELWDSDRRFALKERLKDEIERIELPSKTAINKREDSSKQHSILISRRYRTELTSESLLSAIDMQLRALGWLYYAKDDREGYKYCRDRLDAALYWEGKGGIFADDGNYWSLYFSAGHRPMFGREGRPSECN